MSSHCKVLGQMCNKGRHDQAFFLEWCGANILSLYTHEDSVRFKERNVPVEVKAKEANMVKEVTLSTDVWT
jgi:hypothetical protein